MKKQVLIVADDLELRDSIQDQMESEAMETSCADSISAALSCVMEQEYHLVILDLQLPGVDNKEMRAISCGVYPASIGMTTGVGPWLCSGAAS